MVIPNSLLEEKVKKILSYKYILNVHNFKPINKATIHSKVTQLLQNGQKEDLRFAVTL